MSDYLGKPCQEQVSHLHLIIEYLYFSELLYQIMKLCKDFENLYRKSWRWVFWISLNIEWLFIKTGLSNCQTIILLSMFILKKLHSVFTSFTQFFPSFTMVFYFFLYFTGPVTKSPLKEIAQPKSFCMQTLFFGPKSFCMSDNISKY